MLASKTKMQNEDYEACEGFTVEVTNWVYDFFATRLEYL